MKLSLFIPGIPKPKQSFRARVMKSKSGKSFVHTYQTKEVVQQEKNIQIIVKEQLPKEFKIMENGIAVTKLWYIFLPITSMKKAYKEIINNGGYLIKTTKPDLTDNLNKGLFDALQGVLYLNDSQICSMDNVRKVYGKEPGIILELEEIL